MDLRDTLQASLKSTYSIERELGGGGMSRVFLADEHRLNRRVVVKVLAPELTQGISAERFEREILVAASLQQANIVPVLSAGDAGGTPYFTMPYVEGESLRARLANGPLPIGEILSILRDVARALAYAHERGVVHRDIKPDNVLLSRGTAVVTDFGIAKALSAARHSALGSAAPTLTQIGTSLGTPAYMAPEQAAGDPNADHRADIYAFGCMAYELLTGRPPFTNLSPQRLLAAHMSESPRPVQELRPDTPPLLAALVARCLAKDPNARPESADDVLAALDAASSDSSPQPALPSMRRAILFYAIAFVAVAVIAKAAIVGIGLPDWVFPGALIVMALGLPAILFTAYAQHIARRAAIATPPQGTMATIAIKASPHVSWRRTTMAGVYAVAAFVALIGVFMLLRALGIGPAGSLLARGRFAAREPVVLADFAVQHTDTALGAVVSDAVRAALAQSPMISLVPATTIAATLREMKRPAVTRLDFGSAREIALREGAKAVVDGSVTGVGSGYIVTLRLVSADSSTELASFHETGDGPRGLIDAADKLARELRAKIGESLRSVQASPPLARATTASLEALRQYSLGQRANAMDEDPQRAIPLVRRAVALDSEFSSAWRLLAVVLYNARAPQASVDSASERAYRWSSRLPEDERLQTEAYYFMAGPHADRGRALAAYTQLIERGDSTVATVNAGEVLRSERAYAQADSLNLISIRKQPGGGLAYGNAVEIEIDQGKFAAAAATLKSLQQHAPAARPTIRLLRLLWNEGDFAGVARVSDSARRRSLPVGAAAGPTQTAIDLALLHGQLGEAVRIWRTRTAPASDLARLRDGIAKTIVDAWFNGPSKRATDSLDAALAATPLARLALSDRPYFAVASAYAVAGAPARAQAIIDTYRREVTDTARLRINGADLHNALGEIALAKGDARTAVNEFRRGDVGYDGRPARECGSCVHLNLARAFDLANQSDSAIAHYEAYINTPYWLKDIPIDFVPLELGDPLVLAGAHKRLGELYDGKGDRQRAASHYAAFVQLWKDADPPLQPKVEEAKRKLARLSDTERR